jgi:hypothetical protein
VDAADAGVSRRLELPCRRGRRCLRPWPHPFRSLHHWHGRPATSNRGCSGWTGRFLDCPELRTETMYPAQIGPPPLAGRDAAAVSKGRSGTRTIRQAAAVYHRAASGHAQSLEHAEFGSSRVRTSTMRPAMAVTSTTAAAAYMKSIRLPLENPSQACHVGVTLCDKT